MTAQEIASAQSAGRSLTQLAKTYGVGAAVGLLGVFSLFHDLMGKSLATSLWGNDLDPNTIVWTVEWVYHSLFQRLEPSEVWNANSYFPYPTSLAFSDSMFSAQLIYAPLRLIGFEPLPALYGALVGFCLLGALLTDRLLQNYDFNWGERALIVAAAHFSLPMVSFLLGHFQLFGMQLVPPFLLALHRLLDEWRGKDLVTVTALFCLAGGFATYVVPMAGLVAFLVLLIFSYRIATRCKITDIAHSLGWRSTAISIALLAVFFYVQLLPYLSLFRQLAPQDMIDTMTYSARPWSILLHPSQYSIWYNTPPTNYGYWERPAFPGIPLLALAGLGLLIFWRKPSGARLDNRAIPAVPLAAFALAVLGICWVLSLGPYFQSCPCSSERIGLPFLALAKIIPGVQNIRAPGRYAQFFGLPLGLFAVIGIRWAAQNLRFSLAGAAGILSLVVLVDQSVKAPIYPFALQHAEFYRAAKPVLPEGQPVIVLPMAGLDHMSTWSIRIQQLLSSTIYWGRLVTGVGSRDTPEQNELLSLDNALRTGNGTLADVQAYGERYGIQTLVLFPADYPPDAQSRLRTQAETLRGRVLINNSEGIVVSWKP